MTPPFTYWVSFQRDLYFFKGFIRHGVDVVNVKVCNCRNENLARYERCTFIWLSDSLNLRLLINEQRIFSKVVNTSDFRVLSGWILNVNVGRLQLLVSEEIFFCFVFNDFCSNFLLCDVINILT